MAIDRIIQKIMADAEAEAKQIAMETERSLEALKVKTSETVAEIEKKAGDEAADAARDEKRRRMSRARAEMRKELLEEKQQLIGQVFQKALDSLTALDDVQYAALMKRILLEGVEGGQEEVIIAEPDQKRNWTGILIEANAELSTRGMKGQLTLSDEKRKMVGGFVLRHGKKEVNCNVAYMLKSLREELESEVMKILFPKAGSVSE
jgi:V/A-type H+-transporting ATPase subunit E